MVSFSSALTSGLVVSKVCIENKGRSFHAELAAPSCETQLVGPGETGCVQLRDCDRPEEGAIFDQVDFTVSTPLTSNTDSMSFVYSDFGGEYTVLLEGTYDAFASTGTLNDLNLLMHDSCWDGDCYVTRPVERRQIQAQADCVSLGGTLATISSAEENQRVLNLLRRSSLHSETEVYIGLNWLEPRTSPFVNSTNDEWSFWLDGTLVDYTNWKIGEPSHSLYTFEGPVCGNDCVGYEDAAVIRLEDGEWNDIFEWLFPKTSICQIPDDIMQNHIDAGNLPFED